MAEPAGWLTLTAELVDSIEGIRRLHRLAAAEASRSLDPLNLGGNFPLHYESRANLSQRLLLPAVDILECRAARIEGRGLVRLAGGRALSGPYFAPGLNPEESGWLERWLPSQPASRAQDERYLDGSAAVLMSPADSIYGHWLLDMLHRVVALETQARPDCYVIAADSPAFVVELLVVLGVDARRIHRHDPRGQSLRVERLLHVSSVRCQGRLHSALGRLVQRVMAPPPAAPDARIFLSRANIRGSGRTLLNREAVESCFASRGFRIIRPEELGIRQQLQLFSGCTVLAGETGSALHNALFMRANTLCISLQGRSNANFLQSSISAIKSQRAACFFGESIDRFPGDGSADWLVDTELLESWLPRVLPTD